MLILSCTTFLYVKNHVLARIAEPSNDDYDNDGGDIIVIIFLVLLMILVFEITKKYHIT